MNTISGTTIRSPAGIDEECAVFSINDTSTPFTLHDIAQIGQQYTLSFYVCSDAAGSITAGGYTMATGTDWTRCVVTFTAEEVDVPIYFGIAGTYYLYHSQLEIGCKDTDFTLAPEDTDAKFADYSTTIQMQAAIDVAKDSITQSVSEIYSTKAELETAEGRVMELETWKQEASQKITKDGIIATVGDYYAKGEDLTGLETIATQTAEKFNWIVKSGTSATDFTLTDRTATLIAETISLNGSVKVNGDMLVDGSVTAIKIASNAVTTDKLDAKAVTAAKIDVDDLFSKNITATDLHITGSSTFDGVLNGATGSFSGSVTASTFRLKGALIEIGSANVNYSGPMVSGSSIVTSVNSKSYYDLNTQTGTGGVLKLTPMYAVQLDGDLYGVDLFTCDEIWASEGHIADVTANNVYTKYIKAHSDMDVLGNAVMSGTLTVWGNIGCQADIFCAAWSSDNTISSSPNAVCANNKIYLSSSSSIRYKDVIGNLSDADIKNLYDIPTYWFKYKPDYLSADDERYNKPIPGFLVEDFEPIMPIAVDHNADGSPEMWNSNIITPVMFEMVKYNHREIVSVGGEMEAIRQSTISAKDEIMLLRQEFEPVSNEVLMLRQEIEILKSDIARLEGMLEATA